MAGRSRAGAEALRLSILSLVLVLSSRAWPWPAWVGPPLIPLAGQSLTSGHGSTGYRSTSRSTGAGVKPRVLRMAIGADLRAYAQSLPVPPDYTGPPYNGPSSVNDAFVDHLLNMYKTQAKLPMKYSYLMALDVLDILKQEKSLQRVAVPPGSKITVVGDIHGQYFDFVHMIEQVTGKPSPQNPILFNGDFVDRGPWSVEVLLCLYAFKLQYPTAVHFNRGNHESEMTNYQYGFANEVKVKYEDKLMELFSETFRYLPLATVLENQVFVSHAGVPGPQERLWEDWMQKAPDEAAGVLRRDQQVTLAEIEATNRVCEPNPMDFPLVIDFLWSDPKGANGYGPSTRVPMVYTFGPDVAQRFLQANNLKYMLRSHETKSAGFQETIPNVITVFSAPNYIDRAGNLAAVAVLTNQGGNLDKQFVQFQHQPHPDIESGAYMKGKSLAPS